jgi:hypothetical protein
MMTVTGRLGELCDRENSASLGPAFTNCLFAQSGLDLEFAHVRQKPPSGVAG